MKKTKVIVTILSLITFGFIVSKTINMKQPIQTKAFTVTNRSFFNFFWSNQEGVLETPIASNTIETYHPNDRTWNGLPAIVASPHSNRLWSAWMTGGHLEPHQHNYHVIYYSDDNGLTWSDEFLILDPVDESRHLYTPNLFYDPDGIFWYTFNYSGTYGIMLLDADEPNPSENLRFSTSVYHLTPQPIAHIPTILSERWNNLWLCPLESPGHLLTQRIFASANKVTWEEYGTSTTTSPGIKRWNESQIVELSNGTLMMLARLDGGTGVERNYSYDGGRSWSVTETDLPRPFVGPGSKLEIKKLKSGNILLLTNDSKNGRERMMAFLSTDDGQTWPYELMLDDRDLGNVGFWGVSYPNFTQANDGTIYAIWDQRTPVVEICMARFSEQDLITGRLASTSFTWRNVVRNSDYVDIKDVDDDFVHELEVARLDRESITSLKATLPTTVTVKDTNDETHILSGTWSDANVDVSQAGIYNLTFEATNKPVKLIDSYGLLRVKILVASDETPNGIDHSKKIKVALIIGGSFALVSIAATSFIFIRKGRIRRKSEK